MLRSLWAYRQFVATSIRNELLTPFARSKLGGVWVLLNPLAQVCIYALILSNVLAAKLPGIDNKYAYAIYLMAGLLGWNLFTEIITRCLNIFIQNGGAIKKINFPLITLPTIVIGSSLLGNLILFLVMCCVIPFLGLSFSLHLFWLLPITIVVVLFSAGLGLILGVLCVFIRDIAQLVPIVIQILFWFTPIVYPATIIPEQYRDLFSMNPMYAPITAYQDILLYRVAPNFSSLIPTIGISVTLLIIALHLFKRSLPDIMDSI